MPEAFTRRHGLEPCLKGLRHSPVEEPGVVIDVVTGYGHLNVRGDPGNAGFMTAACDTLGQPLPTVPNTTSSGAHTVFWLGPDEWLVTVPQDSVKAVAKKLEGAMADWHAAVNDISGGLAVLSLGGLHARDVLMAGCTLDFHPRAFPVGACAQSGLGKAPALFWLADGAPTFELIVRRSFAEYVLTWLCRAGAEYGSAVRGG